MRAMATAAVTVWSSPRHSTRQDFRVFKFHRIRFDHNAYTPMRGLRLRLAPLSSSATRAAPDRSAAASGAADREEEPLSVLFSLSSRYNDITVVDTPRSRTLLLDSSRNIHSMLNKEQIWTGSYWDEFACLPAIIPKGPIAILGLGVGTAAHLMLQLWPSLHLFGWEIDEILIDVAREFFDLSKLEKPNEYGGLLTVQIGDALAPTATVEGGFAGIIVDLFSDGKIIPELHQVETWSELGKKLMPNGRIMVNCDGEDEDNKIKENKADRLWTRNSAIKALSSAFPGNVSWKRMEETESENYLALTGPLPDLDAWSNSVPSMLSWNVMDWTSCEL